MSLHMQTNILIWLEFYYSSIKLYFNSKIHFLWSFYISISCSRRYDYSLRDIMIPLLNIHLQVNEDIWLLYNFNHLRLKVTTNLVTSLMTSQDCEHMQHYNYEIMHVQSITYMTWISISHIQCATYAH